MSISLRLLNFNQLFSQLKTPPLIINDVMGSSEDEKENLKNQIYTKYNSEETSDILSNLPSCECTQIVGEYNIGVVCTNCHTTVVAPMSQAIEPILWMRAPKGVLGLTNPHVWTMLSKRFTKSGFNVIEWICNTNYQIPPRMIAFADELRSKGIGNSYNYFVKEFNNIMDILFAMSEFSMPNQRDYFKELLLTSRDCVFSKFLPIPNKALFIIEDNNSGKWVDDIIYGAVDAINTIASIDNEMPPHSLRTKENRTVRAIIQLANFSDDYVSKKLAPKPGILRKNVFATRVGFSFRTVISSITDQHSYNEIHIPWGVAVTVLRYHLMNKMLKMGFTVGGCVNYLNEHTKVFCPMLDGLFKEFIGTGKHRGISCTIGRNPSLERGSIQLVRITKVKVDMINKDNMNVPSTGISINIVKGLNADFDGDECNFILTLDEVMEHELRFLEPHNSVFNLDQPRKVTSNLSQPKTVVASVSHWVHSTIDVDPAKLKMMESLYI
jgi:hypothetical protein